MVIFVQVEDVIKVFEVINGIIFDKNGKILRVVYVKSVYGFGIGMLVLFYVSNFVVVVIEVVVFF